MRAFGVAAALVLVAVMGFGCEDQKREDVPQVDLDELEVETPAETGPEVTSESPVAEAVPVEPVRAEPPRPPVSTETPTPAAGRSYTMQPGDTLYTLARRFYGDGKLWTKIYEANKDKIRDVYDIPVGTQLTIPPK